MQLELMLMCTECCHICCSVLLRFQYDPNLPSTLREVNFAQLHLTKIQLSISIVKSPIISIRHALLNTHTLSSASLRLRHT